MKTITLEQARKVLETVDVGLCKGVGEPTPGGMCVEAAVCYALGQPHGDEPTCVANAVRRFKININDSDWSSNAARARGMRRVAIAQLGSAGTIDEVAFAKRLTELTIRRIVPVALRAAGLEEEAKRCEEEGTAEAAEAAAYAARATYAVADAVYAVAEAADAVYAADAYAAPDEVLTLAASLCEQVLREMKAPGVALLDQLIPLP